MSSNKKSRTLSFDEIENNGISKRHQLSQGPEHFSEYQTANERFNIFTKNGKQVADASNPLLDCYVGKLCGEDPSIDVGSDSSLFYELIFYSDFIQIKDEFVDNFFSHLCNSFILSDLIDDIIQNLFKLNDIPHIRGYIARGFFKILQICPTVDDNSLVLTYSRKKLWYQINLKEINSITIRPSAYKVMLSNEKFNFKHLNFLLQLFDVKELVMRRCNMNGRDTKDLFKDLNLISLNISECGTSVNEIISMDILGSLKNLKILDLSNIPLFAKTLEKIGSIPLKNLNIARCVNVSGSGKFINSILFNYPILESYDTDETREEIVMTHIDLLWMNGILKDTIEVLNVSYNHVWYGHLERIMQLPLKELDITGIPVSLNYPDISFPVSLKVLKARLPFMITYKSLKVLCQLELERLELDYYENPLDDFTELNYTPITFTLKELYISSCSNKFSSFISNLQLKVFECKSGWSEIDTETVINSLISNPLGWTHLQVLKIEVKDIERILLTEFKKLNLIEFSILGDSDSSGMNRILSCENLHQSVLKLELSVCYKVEDEDLVQIVKFKKLEKLSFCFSHGISKENLRKVTKMTTLKKLEISAQINDETDKNMAELLCIAPITHLQIIGFGKMTDNLEFLPASDHFLNFTKNLVTLHVLGTFQPGLAIFWKNADLETIELTMCEIEGSTFSSILDNKHLIFTLEFLRILSISKFNLPEGFSKLHLSKLVMQDVSFDIIDLLRNEPISKSLRYLGIGNIESEYYKYVKYLQTTSLSEVYEV